MSQLDDVVAQVRRDADALAGFVLTRRGGVVTRDGPRDLSDRARRALADAADRIAGTSRLAMLSLGQGEISVGRTPVPVDCHIGVASDRAVLCLVVARGSDPSRVTNALQVGLRAIEPMLERAFGKFKPDKPRAKKNTLKAKKVRDTSPRITVEPARNLGAATLEAIDKELARSGGQVPAPDIPREALRMTLPWTAPAQHVLSSEPVETPQPLLVVRPRIKRAATKKYGQ